MSLPNKSIVEKYIDWLKEVVIRYEGLLSELAHSNDLLNKGFYKGMIEATNYRIKELQELLGISDDNTKTIKK